MLTLIAFPSMPGTRSLSAFCYKAEALLAMAGKPYICEYIVDLSVTPRGKVPVLRDGELVIPDSALIQAHLERYHGLNADRSLTTMELSVAEAFRRLGEDHLYWVILYSRWIDPRNETTMINGVLSALPEDQRQPAFMEIRRSLDEKLAAHGLGLHEQTAIYDAGRRDLDAIAGYLDDKAFFLGDEPTTIDATIVGLLSNILNPAFTSPLRSYAETVPAFRAYVIRFEEEVFKDKAIVPAAA
ncbi:glutathione S-transferase family protein [Rhizobiales bacterium]|uniref:glutathione S-transferase family protein n=1 Tax=Hongsoonwoonella zoysiae TaxID=2821844 RepID=UPI00155FAC2A|nr:glutathione S-transferase family protein [Hongsoonwoonella zoysiae]NRG18921.1 glutathione S-transferase family protein [Hongsoonwoonella zoysiae]